MTRRLTSRYVPGMMNFCTWMPKQLPRNSGASDVDGPSSLGYVNNHRTDSNLFFEMKIGMAPIPKGESHSILSQYRNGAEWLVIDESSTSACSRYMEHEPGDLHAHYLQNTYHIKDLKPMPPGHRLAPYEKVGICFPPGWFWHPFGEQGPEWVKTEGWEWYEWSIDRLQRYVVAWFERANHEGPRRDALPKWATKVAPTQ